MAGFIEISFAVEGAAPLQSAMVSFGNDIRDLSPAWAEVGKGVRADFADQFLTEGGLYGTEGLGWEPLAASTVRERIRKGYGGEHMILQRDGTLFESVAVEGAMGNITEIRPDGASFGTAIPYAAIHQRTNYWTNPHRLPNRQIVGLTWERRSAIIRELSQFISRQVAANFPGTGGGEEE